MQELRSRWSPQAKLTISLLIIAFFIYLLSRFSAILAPMVLAVILAYVLSPLVSLIQNRLGVRRALATLIIYILLLAVIVTLPAILLPPLAAQFTGLNLDIQRILLAVEDFLRYKGVAEPVSASPAGMKL